MQWRSLIITPSHLANQCYSARIYVNHPQTWIGMTGSLPIYYYYTYSIKPGSGGSSHGSEFSWLNHWVHTAVVTRKQQLISQPPVHSGSILTRLLITLHGKNILIRQVKRDLEAFWFFFLLRCYFYELLFCRNIRTFSSISGCNLFQIYARGESSVCTVCAGRLDSFSLYLIRILIPSFPPTWQPSPLTHAHTHQRTISHKECTLKRICSPKKVGICKATDRFKCQLSWCTVGTLSYKVVSCGHLRETNTPSFTPSAAWTLYGPTVAMNVTVNHLSSWQALPSGSVRSSHFIQIITGKKKIWIPKCFVMFSDEVPSLACLEVLNSLLGGGKIILLHKDDGWQVKFVSRDWRWMVTEVFILRMEVGVRRGWVP